MKHMQPQEAAWFEQANGDLVTQVRHGLLNRMQEYVSVHEGQLPQKVTECLQAQLGQGLLESAFLVLRGQASALRDSTNEYWSLIDAAGFFADATGTQWPYMTQARRYQALLWSLEYLQGSTMIH